MNGAQLHLLLNHVPLFAPAVGATSLLLALGRRSDDAVDIALWILLAGALMAIPAYCTGEGAERVVKNYPAIARKTIGAHEEAAWSALIAMQIVAAAAAAALAYRRGHRRRLPRWAWLALFAAIAASLAAIARTSHLGGLIRHEELRRGPTDLALFPSDRLTRRALRQFAIAGDRERI